MWRNLAELREQDDKGLPIIWQYNFIIPKGEFLLLPNHRQEKKCDSGSTSLKTKIIIISVFQPTLGWFLSKYQIFPMGIFFFAQIICLNWITKKRYDLSVSILLGCSEGFVFVFIWKQSITLLYFYTFSTCPNSSQGILLMVTLFPWKRTLFHCPAGIWWCL